MAPLASAACLSHRSRRRRVIAALCAGATLTGSAGALGADSFTFRADNPAIAGIGATGANVVSSLAPKDVACGQPVTFVQKVQRTPASPLPETLRLSYDFEQHGNDQNAFAFGSPVSATAYLDANGDGVLQDPAEVATTPLVSGLTVTGDTVDTTDMSVGYSLGPIPTANAPVTVYVVIKVGLVCSAAWTKAGGNIHASLDSVKKGNTSLPSGNQTIPLKTELARLTLKKKVVNNSGGSSVAADFTLRATGPQSLSGEPAPGTSLTGQVVFPFATPGEYTLGESGPKGYTPGAWSCSTRLDDGELELRKGASYTCEITNDDAPIDLRIAKTDHVTQVTAGGTTTYTVVVTNDGPHKVVNAAVTDTLPAAVASATWTCAPTPSCGSATGTGSVNTTVSLAAGASATFTIDARIAPGAAAGQLINTATVAAPTGVTDKDLEDNSATDTDTLTRQADIRVTKTDGSSTYTPGGSITYTVTVRNLGPSSATGLVVSDQIPSEITTSLAGITCAATAGASCGTLALAGNLLTATGGSLPVDDNTGPIEGLTITISGIVAPTATTPELSNTATASAAEDLGPNGATDTSTRTPDVDLQIAKTANPVLYTPGQPITYTVTVRNTGVTTASGVTVGDVVPSSVVVTSTSCATTGSASCGTLGGSGNTLELNGAVLPTDDPATQTVEHAITITIVGTVSPGASSAITNTATADSPEVEPVSDDATSTLDPSVDLAVTKTDGSPTYVPGGPITYTIEVVNQNVAGASNVSVIDDIPASILNAQWTCTAANGASCGATTSGTGDVAIGGAVVPGTIPDAAAPKLTITVTGTVAAETTGLLSNTVTVGGDNDLVDANSANNSATDVDSAAPDVDLVVTKTDGSPTYTAGGPISYTITVRNAGLSNASGVAISDTLPVSITGASWSCVASGTAQCGTPVQGSGHVAITGAALPAGVGNTLTITVSGVVASGTTGPLTNTVSAATAQGGTDRNPADNTAGDTDTPAPRADLAITKAVDRAAGDAGTNVVFTLAVTNLGPSDAAGVVVTDTLPAGLTLVSATPSQGTCGGAVECNLGALAAGASATVRVEARLTAPGALRNVARVSAATPDPSAANNEAAAEVRVLPTAGVLGNTTALLAIRKAGPATAAAGKVVTYAIRVSVPRNSPSTARSVIVRDVLPRGMTLASSRALNQNGSLRIEKGTIVIRLGDMRAGTSRIVQVRVRIGSRATGRLVNVATAQASNAAAVRATAATRVTAARLPAPAVTG